jgi:hypothetical protein
MTEVKHYHRPRTHDRLAIAFKLIEWAKLPDSINLNKFCVAVCDPPIPPQSITLWAKECDSFREAYEIAKGFLGTRREEWLQADLLHVKAYDLNASVYDHFIKEEKLFMEKYKAELGNISTSLAPNQSVIDQAKIIMNQQNEIEKLKAIINAGQCETSEIVLGSDPQV